MIYKISFDDGRIDWCTSKSILHLIKSYDADFDLPIQEIESIEEISDSEAKTIMVKNTEYHDDIENDEAEEISLYDLKISDDFDIIASTEFI